MPQRPHPLVDLLQLGGVLLQPIQLLRLGELPLHQAGGRLQALLELLETAGGRGLGS